MGFDHRQRSTASGRTKPVILPWDQRISITVWGVGLKICDYVSALGLSVLCNHINIHIFNTGNYDGTWCQKCELLRRHFCRMHAMRCLISHPVTLQIIG